VNLLQKLIEVRKQIDYLQKDTKGYNYVYVSGSSVLSKIRPIMDAQGVILKTEIEEYKLNIQPKEHIIEARLLFTWINAEKPEESLTIKSVGCGQDTDTAKAIGKLMTYSERYFLLKFFNVPTDDDDPDAFRKANDSNDKTSKPAAKEPQGTASDDQIIKINNLCADLKITTAAMIATCVRRFDTKIIALKDLSVEQAVDVIKALEEKKKGTKDVK